MTAAAAFCRREGLRYFTSRLAALYHRVLTWGLIVWPRLTGARGSWRLARSIATL